MENSNAALDEKIDAAIDQAKGLKRNHGRYTLEEAAAFISERTGEGADGLKNKLIAAVKNGDLARYAPFSFVKKDSGIVRDFFEHVYWNDLNGWLEKNEPRLDFKFPQPIAETIDAMAQKHGEQAGAPAPQKDALVTPAKVGDGETATEDEEPERIFAGPASYEDADAQLAQLFDSVPVTALEKMFPAEGKWKGWAEHATRNKGLKAARTARGLFNPYRAGIWFAGKGIKGWDLARCRRTLANNLPARSLDSKHLLTGELE